MVDIYLLGRFAVIVDGIPLSGEAAQKRRLALLPVLAGTDLRPITRDRVLGVLWPDHDSESGRHLLSAGVHVLRRSLGADAIISHGDELALNPALVTVDTIAFRSAVAAGDDETALRLYEGPFLDAFHVSGAPDFEQWVDAERAELAGLYVQVLERAAGPEVTAHAAALRAAAGSGVADDRPEAGVVRSAPAARPAADEALPAPVRPDPDSPAPTAAVPATSRARSWWWRIAAVVFVLLLLALLALLTRPRPVSNELGGVRRSGVVPPGSELTRTARGGIPRLSRVPVPATLADHGERRDQGAGGSRGAAARARYPNGPGASG